MAAAPPWPPAALLLGHLLKYGMRVDRQWGPTPEHFTDTELRHLFILLPGSGKGLARKRSSSSPSASQSVETVRAAIFRSRTSALDGA
jgi:hypothetical protein